MKRPLSLLPSVVILVLAACTGCSGDPTPPSASGSSQEFLSVGTAPPGGAFFVVGGAIAGVLNTSRGENSWQVTAEATKGSQENIRRLDRGDLELALANAAISYFAVRGEGRWDKKYDIRAVMTLAPNVALFIAPEASGVATLADLRGRRVVMGPAGAGFDYFIRPLLAEHGLSYDAEISALHATQAGAVEMLADGSAAAAFLGGAVPTASITQASTSQAIRFVPFDPQAVERLVENYLFFNEATIPAATYPGQAQEFHGLDVGSMHLITTAAVDEDLIYRLTKTIYENRAAVVEIHKAGRAINERNVVRDTGTAFHPGAIRYYEEIGIWPTNRSN